MDFDFVRMGTTAGACPWCGKPYGETFGVTHGMGICNAPVAAGTTKYIGVTPDQVRQIMREELERHAQQHREQP